MLRNYHSLKGVNIMRSILKLKYIDLHLYILFSYSLIISPYLILSTLSAFSNKLWSCVTIIKSFPDLCIPSNILLIFSADSISKLPVGSSARSESFIKANYNLAFGQ